MLSFTATAIIAVLWLSTFSIIESIYKSWQTHKGKRRIPCDPTVPIIGNGLSLLKATTLSDLRRIIFSYQRDAPLSCAWIFNKLIIMVNEPKYIEATLAKSVEKPEEFYGIFSHAATGIFIRNGEKWSKMRTPLNKLMRTKFINRWVEVFAKKADEFCRMIAVHQGAFDLQPLTFQCTFQIIAETHLGIECSNQIEGKEQLSEIFRIGLENIFMTASSLKRKLFQFLTRRRDPQVRRIVEITKSIINKRRAVLSSLESNIDHGEPSCYTDVIIQIAREEGADEEEMCKLAVDFLVAGSETTSTTISCAILFLAMHPEYQEKVQDELRQIFKDSRKTPASTDDLHKMKYLEMVIYETLRHCGIPLVARRLATDTNLDGYHLPSKSLLMFRFMNVCRNLQWWDRPSAFSPDNFLPEAEAARPKGSFTPFSLGTRSCPGNIFALTSMKVILSTALREFTFTTNLKFEEITYQYGLMQTPESLVVTAHPRVVDYTKEESL